MRIYSDNSLRLSSNGGSVMVKRKAKKVCPYRVGNRVSKVE